MQFIFTVLLYLQLKANNTVAHNEEISAIQIAHSLGMQRVHQQHEVELSNQANEHARLIQQMHDAAAEHTKLQRKCEEHIQRCHTLETARDADGVVSEQTRVQLVDAMEELSKSRVQHQVWHGNNSV